MGHDFDMNFVFKATEYYHISFEIIWAYYTFSTVSWKYIATLVWSWPEKAAKTKEHAARKMQHAARKMQHAARKMQLAANKLAAL